AVLALRARDVTNILEGDRLRGWLLDELIEPVVDQAIGTTEHLVPFDEAVDRASQGVEVEAAIELTLDRDMVEGAPGIHLRVRPHELMGERRRQRNDFALDASDAETTHMLLSVHG